MANPRTLPPDLAPDPDTSTEEQPTPDRKNRVLLIAFAAVVVFGLLTAGIYALHQRDTQPPAAVAPSPVSTTAPAPTPTLNERSQAALAAQAAYTAHIAAYERAGRAGGGDMLPPYLAATVTGPMRAQAIRDMKELKAGKFNGIGAAKVYVRTDALRDFDSKTPEAILAACLDQTGLEVTKGGKPYSGTPKFLREQVIMHQEDGLWKVYRRTNVIWTGSTCVGVITSQ